MATARNNSGGSRRRVVSVVGARPQFIKLAALAPHLAHHFDHRIIHTGQHYDHTMSAVFFRQLRLPRIECNLRVGGGSHAAMTGRMLMALERVLQRLSPDLVLVYGDTNTTLAGALAAAKLGVPVAHVEAGLRSGVAEMPEEINRKVTDHLAALHFCPTPVSLRNLRREGITTGLVHSGDLMFELLDRSRGAIRNNGTMLKRHGLHRRRYVYLTVHPRTRERMRRFGLARRVRRLEHVHTTTPLAYLDSLTAAARAEAVLTDSGGLQKEALFLGTPVLTLREETEWTETLRRGNRLVGLSAERVQRALRQPPRVRPVSATVRGRYPSEIIIERLRDFLSGR